MRMDSQERQRSFEKVTFWIKDRTSDKEALVGDEDFEENTPSRTSLVEPVLLRETVDLTELREEGHRSHVVRDGGQVVDVQGI